tara:strand:- start:23 stop:1846 length:1824 start_codon:yes stop_codon:yes gene_type:complete
MISKIKTVIFFIVFTPLLSSQSNQISDYKKLLDQTLEYIEQDYVDSVSYPDLIISSMKGMLKPLDPYTRVVIGSSKERLDLMTKGKYGGVGIRIGVLRDTLTVLSPMENSPAYTEGIKAGDQIVRIDSTDAIGFSTREASKIIKGELGSKVTLHIRRPGQKGKFSFELTRANITVKDVPYWQVDENSIGYIRVTRFSRNTYEDFLKALKDIDSENFTDSNGNGRRDIAENFMDKNKNGIWDEGERFADKNKNGIWDEGESFDDLNGNGEFDTNGNLKGLIIDLRGNSGGLLREAIGMLNSVIKKGEPLLQTKGKNGKVLRTYKSTTNPVLSEDVPLVVLVNKSSASASEIIAGVIQDLDRGLILGKTTFGKGLVQQPKSLNDTISIKVTNAKYYIPSGRLIQKEDYGLLKDMNSKDSVFYTLNMKRPVNGGGGIAPDIKVEPIKPPAFISSLWKERVFLSFSSEYINKNKISNLDFEISSKVLDDFETYCDNLKSDISYTLPGERELKLMKEKLDINTNNSFSLFRDNASMSRNIKKMEKYYLKEKSRQFSKKENKKWLINGLEREFARIIDGESARLGASLKVDSEYDEALRILMSLDEYYSLLGF